MEEIVDAQNTAADRIQQLESQLAKYEMKLMDLDSVGPLEMQQPKKCCYAEAAQQRSYQPNSPAFASSLILSAATLSQWKAYQRLTDVLREQQIIYRWGFLTRLIIIRNCTTSVVVSVEEGVLLLQQWNLCPTEEPESTKSLRGLKREWSPLAINSKWHPASIQRCQH
ncbi:Hypothetical predicted protein [Pelobates cultripes]|uniref:Uncharacterized protein n=1 Tax=Pelobates cultripes TaxID=61616 RepID=A0AAD1S975_PELCU|nr:Hypothetical predicted protein [Pelobates cultripes]